MTSNRALQRVKHLFQAAKAGHTGSLDPLATGLLPICLGAATRVSGYLLDARKTYRVVAELGVATDSGDADGTITGRSDAEPASESRVRAVFQAFTGELQQVPPMFSALKQGGRRLHELARQGEVVDRAPRSIVVHELTLDEYRWPRLAFTVACSKGTYVRSLVVDMAAALNTLGHVRELRRTAVGPFDGMRTEAELEAILAAGGFAALDRILEPLSRVLGHVPEVRVDAAGAADLAHGRAIAAPPGGPVGTVRIEGPTGLVAIGEITVDRRLHPRRVFASQGLETAPPIG